jgi:hypothetical protein
MECYCIEKDEKFIFCIENAEGKYIENIEHAWFKLDNDKYIKEYPNNFDDKKIIKNNFKRLGKEMFESKGDWKKSLLIFAKKCFENNIEWYITGSISEAIIGVEIIPHDIDIITHERDFYKIKELFINYLVEPFVDNKGTWVVQYFGRICIDGVMFDIAADKKMNSENYDYENITWENYKIKKEPLLKRYEIEKRRNREERIKKIEEYMEKNNIKCGHCT